MHETFRLQAEVSEISKGGNLATIKDVARHAGVAISTASAAINRSAPVSKDVLSAVAAAIRAVGYVPHAGARSLRSGRSNLIGLVVPNIANPWCGAVAREVENVAALFWHARQLGEPHLLDAREMAHVATKLERYGASPPGRRG